MIEHQSFDTEDVTFELKRDSNNLIVSVMAFIYRRMACLDFLRPKSDVHPQFDISFLLRFFLYRDTI